MSSTRRSSSGAPFLKRVYVVPERVPTHEGFPFGLSFVRDLELSFKRAVTYLVGENGSGKSTLIEAIAERADCLSRAAVATKRATGMVPSNTARLVAPFALRSVGGPRTDTSFGPNTKLTLRRTWISVGKMTAPRSRRASRAAPR